MDKYKLEMNGSNPEKTIESSHQLIIDTIKTLMDIDSTSIITNIQLTIEHIESNKKKLISMRLNLEIILFLLTLIVLIMQ